jgi:hypothetical protein
LQIKKQNLLEEAIHYKSDFLLINELVRRITIYINNRQN